MGHDCLDFCPFCVTLDFNTCCLKVHVCPFQTDVTDQDSVDLAKSFVEKKVQNEGLNLLINNAGVLDKSGFQEVTREAMRKSYEVNAIGPLMMVQV